MTTSVNPAAKPPPHWGDDRLKDTLHVAKDKLAGGLEHLHEHGKEGFDFAKEQTHKGFDLLSELHEQKVLDLGS
eukprot:CAMPEP_0168422558 /NCGR_PEP_ID=MMETSP0228-20121227/33857_1 /TAXON_ID=133427 /ORGANISM="Protoceratium reticulatum, Strain CCCM 535 (=CCMP 1889)" /LENGTH=73 /DNA_ID=CAMNT_0008436497 /DNA_START=72 /DNA_END=294 /DNA_ORIENTATION=+